MKIAFICSDRGPCPPVKGGAIQLLISKIAPLIARSHDVTVFSITDPALPVHEKSGGVTWIRFDRSVFFPHVCESIRAGAFDLIQVYNRPGWLAELRQAAPDARLFLSLHNLIYDTLKMDRHLAAGCLQEADQVLTVSRFVAEDTVAKFPGLEEKTHVLYTGVDTNEYAPVWSEKGKEWRNQIRARYQIAGDERVLLFVGRLVSEKGCHLILEAMKELSETSGRVRLLIVGSKWYADDAPSGYIEKLKQAADELEERVVFTSYVPVEEIPKYFAASDIFICPSQWKEPLARVHYEAMAAGLPVVTTARGGNPELFLNDGAAKIIRRYKDPRAFAQVLNPLLADPDLADQMGRAGRSKVEEIYNFQRVADELETLYQTVTKVAEK
ncbi:glycosyltransferase family 4 protein [Sporolactobacillus sp. THM19-2]|jgi:glycosyltransferase involved in cell wall biosynthesis|uniref:glycosyltransferase family 4 protein n=1 Tax=Sporolactobacillus sp. THM19-2 TaxID=2511171 RepID=UPI00101FB887|nr:glycosyltransferase family 4 protein [Sporolactobacillus sp. THM19-2]RYL94139.1 glycosyltransferase family 1 protein [Sporolactobacillus sp. THM19-2]